MKELAWNVFKVSVVLVIIAMFALMVALNFYFGTVIVNYALYSFLGAFGAMLISGGITCG